MDTTTSGAGDAILRRKTGVNFLRRFKQAAQPTSLREAVSELQTLAQQQPALAAHARSLADCLPIILADSEVEPVWEMPRDRIIAKWSAGVPLLRGDTIPLARKELAAKWKKLCAA